MLRACIFVLVIIFPILAFEMIGFTLAENAADEEMVNNETMDTITVIQNYIYADEQAVAGTGFTNINNNFATIDPADMSQNLDLRVLRSGTGTYSHNSTTSVQNNTLWTYSGEFAGNSQNITAKDDTNAVYSEMNYQFPGSFRTKAVRSLWKEQTYSKNHVGIISMNSLFDYAKKLDTETTTTLNSDVYNYEGFIEAGNSTIGSSMDINSRFDGSAHLGVTLNDVRGGIGGIANFKADSTALMDEDYRGSFNLSKKMAVNIVKTADYADNDQNYEGYEYEDYPWLPCLCNTGWNDMAIHDTRYHSAKGFFDCTSCMPSAPCKN